MLKQLVVAVAALVPFSVSAQQPPVEQPRTLNVTGVGTVEREPEKAVLTLAVESEASTAREASQQNAQRMDAVATALRGAGIPARDIRTLSYQLSPVYARVPADGGSPKITGYRAMNTVRVAIDSIARVGRVIDTVIDAGANRVAHLVFELRDYESARREALERAVSSARREAETVAAASGQRLGEPISITTSTAFPEPRPVMMDAAIAMAGRQAVDTPIETGTLTVRATVHIVYKLEVR